MKTRGNAKNKFPADCADERRFKPGLLSAPVCEICGEQSQRNFVIFIAASRVELGLTIGVVREISNH
jgi:hypothetical protein